MEKLHIRIERQIETKLGRLRNSDPIFKAMSLSQLVNFLVSEAIQARLAEKYKLAEQAEAL